MSAAVALGGVNDTDAGHLVDWAWELGVTPRFIETLRFSGHVILITRNAGVCGLDVARSTAMRVL